MNHPICDSCETVNHCRQHGCIPLQPQPLHSLQGDVRELHQWLNEEPNRPLNRTALARVLAYLQGYTR